MSLLFDLAVTEHFICQYYLCIFFIWLGVGRQTGVNNSAWGEGVCLMGIRLES